jgi:hypothetical protein
MAQTVTVSLVAKAIQKLEAIRHNEEEVLSDQECSKRAEEVAEAALQAIAVCSKYLLSRNAEARIDGFGNFYLKGEEIDFVPDEDVLQYALLKQQEPEQQQLVLRNAFVRTLLQALKLIPLLELAPNASVSAEDSDTTPEQKLLNSIFGETGANRFEPTVSHLLSLIVQELRGAGAEMRLVDAVSAQSQERNATAVPTSDVVDYMLSVERNVEHSPYKVFRVGPGGISARSKATKDVEESTGEAEAEAGE